MSLTRRQLALRADAIGASETAALVGLSKYASPIELYESHVALLESGQQIAKEATIAMDLGVELEEPVARVYAKRAGVWIRPVHSVIDPRWPHSLATPDRVVFLAKRPDLKRRKLTREEAATADDGLEVKTTTWRDRHRWGPQGSDFLPDEHLVQVTKCMGLLGLKHWTIAAYFRDGGDLRTYSVHFNADFFATLVEADARFMVDHVLRRVPPPVDGTEAYRKFLDQNWGGTNWEKKRPNLIQADDAEQALCLQLAKTREALRRLGALEEKIANQLRARIEDFGGIEAPSFGKIYWRRGKDRQVVDHAAIGVELHTLAGLVVNAMPDGAAKTEFGEKLKDIVRRHTSTRPGNRPFVPYWSDALKSDLAKLSGLFSKLELAADEACQTQSVESQPTEEEP